MGTITKSRPAVKSSRKPLAPVNVTGRFTPASTARSLALGSALLWIEDNRTGEVAYYFVQALRDGDRLAALHLEKADDSCEHTDGYHVSFDRLGNPSCDCPDATYRPDRPGGCRHVNGVCQALKSFAEALV